MNKIVIAIAALLFCLNVGYAQSAMIYAKDFGAVCDGSADDTAAFQALINQAIATKQAARFYGTCRLVGNLMITSTANYQSIDFAGMGRSTSELIFDSPSGIIVNMALAAIQLHDFMMYSASTSSPGITVTAPPGSNSVLSQFYNLNISGFGVSMNMLNAQSFIIRDSLFNGFGYVGIQVQNQVSPDAGAGSVISNTFVGGPGASAGIFQLNNGGLRIIGNAFASSVYGYLLEANASTSDLIFANNNAESVTFGFWLTRASTAGLFANVLITGNEILANTICGVITDPYGGTWLIGATITGNVCVGNGALGGAWSLNNAVGVVIANNVFRSPSAGWYEITTGGPSTCGSFVVGPNQVVGPGGASNVACNNSKLNSPL